MKEAYDRWKAKGPLWQRLAVAFVIIVLIFGLLFGSGCFLLSGDLSLSIYLGLGGGLLIAGTATYNGWKQARR